MVDTVLVVKVDHVCWNLEALLTVEKTQRIDPIHKILFNLSHLKTVTLDIGLSDLGISSGGLRVS